MLQQVVRWKIVSSFRDPILVSFSETTQDYRVPKAQNSLFYRTRTVKTCAPVTE